MVVLAFVVPCTWLGHRMEKARKQRMAVESLRAIGAEVVYDYDPGNGVVFDVVESHVVARSPEPPGPKWLRHCLGDDFFAGVRVVRFGSFGTYRDSDLANLRDTPDIEELEISGHLLISDVSIEHIRTLAGLRCLSILDIIAHSDTGKDDLPRLKTGRVLGARLSSAALESLKSLPRLEKLHLGIEDFDDQKSECLLGFTHLRQLDLLGTAVTRSGIQRIQRALPGCVVLPNQQGVVPARETRDLEP